MLSLALGVARAPLVRCAALARARHGARCAFFSTAGEGGRAAAAPRPPAARAPSRSTLGRGDGIIDVNPPRGTRDFFPDDKRLQTWLFGKFRAASAAFGFELIDSPVLESEALFTRKAGEEIAEQLYAFEDRGGRRVALRPELTPSLARLILRSGGAFPRPLKWAAIGQCWRYERSTRGRRREHYQWNLDVVGVSGVEAEAELLAAIVHFFRSVGLGPGDVRVKVSSRKLLAGLLADRGGHDPDVFARAAVLIDKRDKVDDAVVVDGLRELGIRDPQSLLGVLDARGLDDLVRAIRAEEAAGKSRGEEGGDADGADGATAARDSAAASGGEAEGDAAAPTSAAPSSLLEEGLSDLARLTSLSAAYGYADWIEVDPGIVRGLAYYTGVVFEVRDAKGELRAVCGGGRYDGLLATFGGAPEPAAGFGFGDAVIVELLKDKGLLPDLPHAVDDVVAALQPEQHAEAARAAAALRARGRSVDLLLERKKIKWILKHAERLGAKRLVVVGPDEAARGTLRARDVAAREEKEVTLDELLGSPTEP